MFIPLITCIGGMMLWPSDQAKSTKLPKERKIKEEKITRGAALRRRLAAVGVERQLEKRGEF